jgi:hypothetical protein
VILTNFVDFRAGFATSVNVDNDGHPEFAPSSLLTIRPFISYDTWNPVAGITIDLFDTNDAAAYVDENHWYLSDPAAATGAPRWEIVRADPSALVSRSGRVTLRLTAAGQALYVVGDSDIMAALLHQVHLYAFNLSTENAYWADLHRCAFAAASFPPAHAVTIT